MSGGSGPVWAVWARSTAFAGTDWGFSPSHSRPTCSHQQYPGATEPDMPPWGKHIVQQAEKHDLICTLINQSFFLFAKQELAQKIKGYQEQIASLNSKCKLLTVKAKHATMLVTVRDAEGLTEEAQELDRTAETQSQPSMDMVSPFVLTCTVGNTLCRE